MARYNIRSVLFEQRVYGRSPKGRRWHRLDRGHIAQRNTNHCASGLDDALVITALAQVPNRIGEARVDFAPHRHSHPQRRIPDELDRVCHNFSLGITIEPGSIHRRVCAFLSVWVFV